MTYEEMDAMSYDDFCEKLTKAEQRWYYNEKREREEAEAWRKHVEAQKALKVGDGVTVRIYTDKEAYTIIKKTAKTITIQLDDAVLSKDYKPNFEIGGFSAICTNASEQRWEYSRNPNAQTYTLRWSDRLGGYKDPFHKDETVSIGRHKYYDYNF